MSRRSPQKWWTATIAGAATALALALQAAVVPGTVASAAPPTSATDASKVPHYFGPWPNWANSPLTLSKAKVVFSDPAGTGVGAEAMAEVDPGTGGIKSVQVTASGHDYSAGTTVEIAGGTTPAQATVTVSSANAVVGFTGLQGGTGYAGFSVSLDGGVDLTVTGNRAAAAAASGGVDAVSITGGGAGYTMPTVDFDYPDAPDGTQAKAHAVCEEAPGDCTHADGETVTVIGVVVDDAGSGYSTAPAVKIRNGTQFDPIALPDGTTEATATATLQLSRLDVLDPGNGYTAAPTVSITDPSGAGSGAAATAVTDAGAVTGVTVTSSGGGYLTQGMKKFVDELPSTCTPGDGTNPCPTSGKFIPNAVPAEKNYNGVTADEYVIGLVQYRTKFSSDLPGAGTLVRGYVQLETADNASISQHVPLVNELSDGTSTPVLDPDGVQYLGVTAPQYLGPFIGATKNKPVRIVFRNLLPKDAAGDLFLPTDSSMMGSGMGPMPMAAPADQGSVLDEVRNPACTQEPKGAGCFKDNRATLHLHGGITPWISDGTPHQWITPAGENTDYPQGVSVQNVPDMTGANGAGCDTATDGCSTFYYTNQQSARLMFYHDHAWGITRLNVYAGEAAGYTIADDTEKKLIADHVIPGPEATLPLIVQDKTFVPASEQLYDTHADPNDPNSPVTSYGQDPTWDSSRWGKPGDLWYHHVYMPAQNPGDASGMSAYGRWMYGPWFWPPATTTVHGPIANPYYDPNCKLDDPTSWQYKTDPFCEPEKIPGTPNVSAGMEQFNDTPVVNGVAYPKVTLEPKPYRLRILNAANDRFFNLQWYTADPNQGDGTTEVALKQSELDAAQTDPNVSPTPVGSNDSTYGPDWVQIANEGGFLPAPTVVDGQQPTTWITDPTRFDVGNVDKHSLLLAPAERGDAVVDFSKFAGKTLILYNDAPAAFPARVPTYDYYTGGPDLSPTGAPTVMPGFGPNTRTVMQVTIAATATDPVQPFSLTALQNAFKHNANGTGVFESGQHPTIVGQAAYNSAYGTAFAASSNCNGGSSSTTCDGLVRVNDTGTFGFNTLKAPTSKMTMAMEPKAIHDEMNSSTFDEFGRMTANLGVEAQPPTPGAQNVTLYPYVNPATELINATNLPKAAVTYDATTGEPTGEVKVTPISTASDGTQIWRFTHNGVDTHPIHFHLYDVQVLNRVTWDNIIIPPDPNELGWKDTVRMSPLEDTIVALRPIIPEVPFEIPNAVRPLNPMMPLGDTSAFNNIDPQGNPTTAIQNTLVNFGWEYVIHCHILSHEEMDMMRPESVALPPNKPDGLASTLVDVIGKNGKVVGQNVKLSWNDNSINETSFLIQRTTDGTTWTDVGTDLSPLDQPNVHGPRTFTDTTSNATTPYLYRVVAQNTVGYGGAFPSMTVTSMTPTLGVNTPAAPTSLVATLQSGPRVSLAWRDNAVNESGFLVERSSDNGATFTTITTAPARNNTGNVTFVDTTVALGASYLYRVSAVNLAGSSAPSSTDNVLVDIPPVPSGVAGTAAASSTTRERVTTTWTDVSNETSYRVEWSATQDFATVAGGANLGANATTYTTGNLVKQIWWVRVRATNALGTSAWSTPVSVPAAP